MKHQPLVSVYLPTRNRVQLLRRSIQSVLDQDYPRFELLVVDDASTDETARALESMASADSRLRCFQNAAPMGGGAARNVAIREARGEFVTGIDDDDLMLPGRLTSLLSGHRDSDAFVCSGFYILHEQAGWYEVRSSTYEEITLAQLLARNVVGNQALMRTDRVRDVGAYDETLPAWQDYDLWTRMVLRYGPARRISDPTYIFFESSDPLKITNSEAAIIGAQQYLERYSNLMSANQLQAHQLMQAAVQRRRLTLHEVRECWGPETRRRVAGYWVRSNLPGSEGLLHAWRRWRRPITELPAAIRGQPN